MLYAEIITKLKNPDMTKKKAGTLLTDYPLSRVFFQNLTVLYIPRINHIKN